MLLRRIGTTVLLSLSCAFGAASCGQSTEPPRDRVDEASSVGDEPTEEAAQADFSASVFRFVTVLADDGKGQGGGWQRASARLKFSDWSHPYAPRLWSCPLGVEMPIRTAINGYISPEHAATLTAAIATDAWATIRRLAPEAEGEVFCRAFRNQMLAMFYDRYRTLGARVKSS